MLKSLVKKFKSAVDDTEEIDEKFFAEVMKEIKDGYKEEGLEGKSIAMSGGDTDKANSIYMQLRAEALQEKAVLDHIEILHKEGERERERKEKIKKEGREKLDNDKLYKALIKIDLYNLIKIYQKEIEDLGYQKTLFFSGYDFKKDGNVYLWGVRAKEKKAIIYKIDQSSSPETTFNLEDKADEILDFAKKYYSNI